MTSHDLPGFKRALEQYAREGVKKIVVAAQKSISNDLYGLLLRGQPVDTSLSRGNWLPSLTVALDTVVDKPAGVARRGSPLTGEEKARLAVVLSSLDALPLGQIVWVANSIHYMKYLEAGSSKQAPTGVLAPSMATIRERIRAGKYSRGGASVSAG